MKMQLLKYIKVTFRKKTVLVKTEQLFLMAKTWIRDKNFTYETEELSRRTQKGFCANGKKIQFLLTVQDNPWTVWDVRISMFIFINIH